MKKHLITFSLLLTGLGILILPSCKDVAETPEENDPDPVAADTACYMTYLDDGEFQTTLEWNSENQLTLSYDQNGDSIFYEYDDGKLSRIISPDGLQEMTAIYADGGDIPTRMNISVEGEDIFYFLIENENGNITKLETHDVDAEQADEVFFITYDNDKMTSFEGQSYNELTDDFTTFINATDLVVDENKNPYTLNFGLFMAMYDNPLAYGKNNILSGTVDAFGQQIEASYTHTYNDHDYPTNSVQSILGQTTETVNYTYNCQ